MTLSKYFLNVSVILSSKEPLLTLFYLTALPMKIDFHRHTVCSCVHMFMMM